MFIGIIHFNFVFFQFKSRFLQIRQPNLRMLAEIMYRQEPEKILGLRTDSLSQLISYSNISSSGNYLLYESGTNGLIAAAMLNSIGANTNGRLVHIHQGNMPQKQAVLALNLEKEQLDRCISVNLYSVLRHYYQRKGGLKRKLDIESSISDDENPPSKIKKSNDVENTDEMDAIITENDNDNDNDNTNGIKIEIGDATNDSVPKWMIENERACELLRENLDALVVVAKEHPLSIVNALLPFMKASRPIAIFSLSREILMETFIELKSSGKVTGLRLTSNWMRMYQVLPNRTHPDVNMNGNSGFLLCGFTIR